jgi:hypothetical protein
MGDDLGGDPDLAAHGVDRDQRTFELAGFGEFVEKVRDGGDLVSLLGTLICASVRRAVVA